MVSQPLLRYKHSLYDSFSRETLTIINNLGLTEEERNDSDAIIAVLKRHIDRKINETMERRKLRRRVQQQGKSFDDYLVSLRELTKTCNFCSEECIKKNIHDQIIEGLLDDDTVEHLLRQHELTLAATITTYVPNTKSCKTAT